MTLWKVKVVGQDSKRIHFQIFQDGVLMFDNPNFSKAEMLELITEGNYDLEGV
jgi:hypothetical protein